MTAPAFSLHAHLRDRILPALAELDGLGGSVSDIQAVFSQLCADDLDFDLRRGPRFASNLCADNAALELGWTFGGADTCGVRYQYEPTAPRRMLKNRYTVFRDRMTGLLRSLGDGYDLGTFRSLYATAMTADVVLSTVGDPTLTIAAVHHYRARPPRIKAYFGCDVEGEPERGHERLQRLLEVLEAPTLLAQARDLRACFHGGGVPRMAGFDFEPDRATEAKVYLASDGLTEAGLLALVEQAGGSGAAREAALSFCELFLDEGVRTPEAFNLVCLGLARRGPPRLKLYLRPAELYDDAETLRRLDAWYARLGAEGELSSMKAALAAVAPLDVLQQTRGTFNYVSVDVHQAGVEKTSVYWAPQIPLMHLAQAAPERLSGLLP